MIKSFGYYGTVGEQVHETRGGGESGAPGVDGVNGDVWFENIDGTKKRYVGAGTTQATVQFLGSLGGAAGKAVEGNSYITWTATGTRKGPVT